MVREVVICTLIGGIVATAYAQQVEIAREKSSNVRPQTKHVAAQPVVEVHPLKIALVEPKKLSVEQMRQAGARAAQRSKRKITISKQIRIQRMSRQRRRRKNKSRRTQCVRWIDRHAKNRHRLNHSLFPDRRHLRDWRTVSICLWASLMRADITRRAALNRMDIWARTGTESAAAIPISAIRFTQLVTA